MSDNEIAGLNARYGLAGAVSFQDGPGGLTIVEIANTHAQATIAAQGAHLVTWTPRAQKPVIWLSRAAKFAPGKSIRGGVPICWPWFGPHAENAAFPGHGFARTVPWEVIETKALPDGATRVSFRINQNDATRAQWPHASGAVMRYTIGRSLACELATRNTGTEAFTLGDALHTYFEVSDVRQVRIQGLDGCPYLDKVDGGKRKRQAGVVSIDGEVDRIYLESRADCVIEDPQWGRRIRIAKRGSRATVVWNPWIEKAAKMGDFGEDGYLNMVCVESANAADDVVGVAPGAEHVLAVSYSVESL